MNATMANLTEVEMAQPIADDGSNGQGVPIPSENSLVLVRGERDPIGSGNTIVAPKNDTQAIHAANSLSAAGDDEPILTANSEVFSSIREKIQIFDDGLRGLPFPMSRLKVHADRISTNHDEFILDKHGFDRLCSTIAAPASYLRDLPSELQSGNLQYGLRKAGSREEGLSDENSEILSRDGQFVGFRRWDLCNLPGTDVIDALRDGLGDVGGASGKITFGRESFTLDVVGERLKKDVRAGDAIQAGIHLEHSLVGDQATLISSYVVRLLCANGLTHRECLGSRKTKRTRRLGAKNEDARTLQLEQIRSLVAETKAKLEQKLDAIQRLQDRKIRMNDVERTFERFLRFGRLFSNNLMRLLQRAWHNEMGGNGELTYFGILNALTWLATHPGEIKDEVGEVIYRVTDRQRAALANLSGIFANQDIHFCPNCSSLVAGRAEATTVPEETKA